MAMLITCEYLLTSAALQTQKEALTLHRYWPFGLAAAFWPSARYWLFWPSARCWPFG